MMKYFWMMSFFYSIHSFHHARNFLVKHCRVLSSSVQEKAYSRSNEVINYIKGNYTTFSFYKFSTEYLTDTEKISKNISRELNGLNIRGTIIIAHEGVNAQLAIETDQMNQFSKLLPGIDPFFKDIQLNVGGIKYYDGTVNFPFNKLMIKLKPKILTDGIDDKFIDWSKAGPEIDSEDWHKELSTYNNNNDSNNGVILIDCRNDYESEYGTFQSSTLLKTSKFSESWTKLEKLLHDKPKDTRILTFCTGGIRCVKVNAYLRQKLGFSNTGRLKDGIIGYERWLSEQSNNNDNMNDITLFKGKNFVFDRRRLK